MIVDEDEDEQRLFGFGKLPPLVAPGKVEELGIEGKAVAKPSNEYRCDGGCCCCCW